MNNLFWPDENSIEQCLAAHIVQDCQKYCSTLLHLILLLIILLTTLNNVGSKRLFNAVFIRPEQVVHFWLCATYQARPALSHMSAARGQYEPPMMQRDPKSRSPLELPHNQVRNRACSGNEKQKGVCLFKHSLTQIKAKY